MAIEVPYKQLDEMKKKGPMFAKRRMEKKKTESKIQFLEMEGSSRVTAPLPSGIVIPDTTMPSFSNDDDSDVVLCKFEVSCILPMCAEMTLHQ